MCEEQQKNHTGKAAEGVDGHGDPELIKLLLLLLLISWKPFHSVKALKLAPISAPAAAKPIWCWDAGERGGTWAAASWAARLGRGTPECSPLARLRGGFLAVWWVSGSWSCGSSVLGRAC